MCRMELMPRTGTAPFILVDNRHGANQTPSSHVANISPPKCLHSVRAAWNDLQTLLGGSFSSGHRLSSVRLVTQSLRICQKQPPPIRACPGLSDTDYSDSSCQELPATTRLF